MLRISSKERITNEAVLRRVQSSRTMLKKIMKRQIKLFAHVMRKGEQSTPILNHLCYLEYTMVPSYGPLIW